jgi:osmotically-inducible protein OsmY
MARNHHKTDGELQRAVLEELRWDTRVDEAEIGVAVVGGVVTLTGTVASWAKKLAAQEAAHRVAGVLDVANDIEVHPTGLPSHSDAAVAHAVRAALEWDVRVPQERIRSTVTAGLVVLEGTVESLQQREDAERAIRHLRGVAGVVNRLQVHAPAVSSERVRAAIEGALERRALREADRIGVAVEDGTVTVSGRAFSWLEKRAILGAAGHAPGVREVVDNVRIDTFA